MHQYRAFGLNLESEILLNELLPCDFEEADVSIHLGEVAPIFNAEHAYRTQITKDTFRMDKERVARFQVEKGNLVTVQPYPGSPMEVVKLYLLGSCMGAALFQRRILPIHGSCVRVGKTSILLTGRSGAGKSTIAAGFLAKGCSILTDDVAAVRLECPKMPVVSPSYPGQKLWEDAIERADGVHIKTSLYRTEDNLSKFAVRRDNCFSQESAPLAAVYEIIAQQVPCVTLEEIKGSAKVDMLLNNIYRIRMAYRMGLADWCYLYSMEIAQSLKAYRIVRPAGEHLENQIAQRILEGLSFA